MGNGENAAAGSAIYRIGRELGSRALRSFAAIRQPHELVVVQRFASGNPKVARTDGVTTLTADGMNQLLRDAACLAKNWHPNIARVRHVDGDAMRLTIATELVDGVTLGDLLASATGAPLLPHAVIVRILVDVLAGLNALHALRDGTRAVGTIHGAVCPANIVVGRDGVARIVSCVRARPVRVGAGSEALAYAAPEALDEGGTKDVRSDVYAVGVILWEALMGVRPYEAKDPAELLARQRTEDVASPTLDPSSPFAGLAEIAMHAMAFESSLRFRTTAEMATALRKMAGTHIAAGSVVAATVAELAGDRIRKRRIELDPSSAPRKRPPVPVPAVRRVAPPPVAAPPVAAPPVIESAPAVVLEADPSPLAEVAPVTVPAPVIIPKPAPVLVLAPVVVPPPAPLRVPAPVVVPAPEPALAPAPVLLSAPEPAVVLASAPPLPSPAPLVTPAAVFLPTAEPPSLSASEPPPPRKRKSR
ncbi:MAG TPA: protein kinase, partial [Labilithrix sp.]|nr:protein kinase [Labilithrix sp.]